MTANLCRYSLISSVRTHSWVSRSLFLLCPPSLTLILTLWRTLQSTTTLTPRSICLCQENGSSSPVKSWSSRVPVMTLSCRIPTSRWKLSPQMVSRLQAKSSGSTSTMKSQMLGRMFLFLRSNLRSWRRNLRLVRTSGLSWTLHLKTKMEMACSSLSWWDY